MKQYQFKVSIMGLPKVYRVIEASGNCTFDDLHDAIFAAFDRYDEHLYSFFITKSDSKSRRSIMQAPEITHPEAMEDFMGFGKKTRSTANTTIDDVQLEVKDLFHYLFDFGDDWWHRIRVESITESSSGKKSVRIVKSVGQSPPQYPEYVDEDEDE
jgi:hypothetical protein